MSKEVFFKDEDFCLNLSMSTGQYDSFDGEDDLFYIGIFDEDDLCYQFDGFSQELVDSVFEELKEKINDGDFRSKTFPETCKLYGLILSH